MLKIRVVKTMLRVTAAAISLLFAFGASAQTVRYVHTDGLGSVVLATDRDRNIVERSEYEPYGDLLNRPAKDGPGYTGHVMDAATGLTYMQQRYYDSQLGLFLSVDQVSAYSDSFKQFNRYRYANGNPYGFIDPDGRESAFKSFQFHATSWLARVVGGTPSESPERRQFQEQVIQSFDSEVEQQVRTIPEQAAQAAEVTATALALSPVGDVAAASMGAKAALTGMRALTVEAKAAQLASRVGGNSLTVRTASGQIRYDLKGASHFSKALQADVPTPHVVTYKNNIIPSGPRAGAVGNISQIGDTVPATMQDMRTIERVLDERAK